jgi:hypothetical protein
VKPRGIRIVTLIVFEHVRKLWRVCERALAEVLAELERREEFDSFKSRSQLTRQGFRTFQMCV